MTQLDTAKHTRNGLATISFTMTGLFGLSLASGFTGILFAISMVLIQAGALIHMPEKFNQAKDKNSGLEMMVYGGTIIIALLLSVTASVATLSSNFEQSVANMTERETLQSAIDGYMEAGYITKALAVKKELEVLPDVEITPLSSAARQVEKATSWQGSSIITGFITTLAFMLDLFVILLTSNGQSNVTVVTPEKIPPDQNSSVSNQQQEVVVTPDVQAVFNAMNDGIIKRLSVREVRQLLRCSQADAMNIARTCRQLELSI